MWSSWRTAIVAYVKLKISNLSSRVVAFEANPFTRLLAILAIFAFPLQFFLDWSGRQDQREIAAWDLLTTQALGNSGKIEAIEYLVSAGVNLTGIDLSCNPMQGISPDLKCEGGVYLQGLNLSRTDAVFTDANFGEADLRDAGLMGLDAFGADFSDTVLWRADFANARLHRAVFDEATINEVSFRGADLSSASFECVQFAPIAAALNRAFFDAASISAADFAGSDFSVLNAFFVSGFEPFGLVLWQQTSHRIYECRAEPPFPYEMSVIEQGCTLQEGFSSPEQP
ncbi:hypothetical protein JANAI62_35960 [Jannaschia pagri]|uniref:Pentapeptide repeat-containing protein n=2 Tax=Roseobacteraceae TaxID=2854170 RepID=A0ABQ4NRD6_9RHOB|nr:hypothetical protein JANAI61_35780 [Jannaschia sp. AI_61]GIT96973.1 hypothetical protein JANAI62_35960 [Jannaschia sp. AI_62]